MNIAVNQLVQSIFSKQSIDECTEQELTQLAEKYPFFSASQLLLIKKLKANNSEKLEAQLQKAHLYFQSPLLLDQLINDKGKISIEKKEHFFKSQDPIIVVDEHRTELQPGSISNVSSPYKAGMDKEKETVIENNILPHSDEVYPDSMFENTQNVSATLDENETAHDIDQPLNIPTLKIEPIDPATAPLSFEPYHTVDYFASQGIKIKEEEKTRDKFGQQLKSFTEWLKTIKKVPPTEIVASEKTDNHVDQLAEHSLTEGTVETEAMAEVWAKQGNIEKAVAIYEKLSLLNPSKSSYFASLIEQLKKS